MTTLRPPATEYVVLVDDDGTAVGTRSKATVHTTDTPLHLAFSCYVFNSRGELLVTTRARHKKTWPGVTTNSCCGHPSPDEDLGEAVTRRLEQELGIVVDAPFLLLPDFRYRARMDDGIVENELCPVFGVLYDGPDPQPNPDEVESAVWISWDEFARFVADGGAVSPWCGEQMPKLQSLGTDPVRWTEGDPAFLPAAAHYERRT